jgi:CheY-like chemotaxis protein
MTLSKMKVVVVHTDLEVVRCVMAWCKDLGCASVDPVSAAGAAVHLLNEKVVDLILCDWNLKDYSALGLLKLIKHQPRFSDIRFIALSDPRSDVQVAIKFAASAGADRFLLTPLSLETFRKAIDFSSKK